MHSFTNEQSAFSGTAGSPYQEILDPLAVYDHQSIGREFANDSREAINQTLRARQAQLRSQQITMTSWKEISSLSDSQRLDRAKLAASRKYETQRIHSQSLITSLLFIGLTALAGVLIALIVQHLNI